MKTPETQHIQNALPIKFEYTGNYSNIISLNEPLLHQLAGVIGKPITTLVIKDGKERVQRTGITAGTFKGPFLSRFEEDLETKDLGSINLNIENGEFEVLINSQVIDGQIRGELKHSAESYETAFLVMLETIILAGIKIWAFSEAKEKGINNLLRNNRKQKELDEFFLQNGSHILLRESHARGNHR